MEPVRSLGGVFGATRVNERGAGGGGKKDADAFRRALEQEAGAPAREGAAKAADEAPVRTGLQQKAAPSTQRFDW